MRQSTSIAATILRLLAVMFFGGVILRLLFLATDPLAARIEQHGSDIESLHSSHTDSYFYYGTVVLFAAALYVVSLPVARAATPDGDVSPAFTLAFTSIRMVAFVFFALTLLWLALEFIEVPIAYIDHAGDNPPFSTQIFSVPRLHSLFTMSIMAVFQLSLWLLARPISGALTRRLRLPDGALPG